MFTPTLIQIMNQNKQQQNFNLSTWACHENKICDKECKETIIYIQTTYNGPLHSVYNLYRHYSKYW